MNPRTLSTTSARVSELCLGTMTFGNPVAADEAARLVHWALDHGINFFDTADMYEGYDRYIGSPGGVAERLLGEALQRRRDQAVVTTKVGNDVGVGKGLGRAHMRRQIDASLGRLQSDYVDIYELHKPDPDTPLAESVGVMAELIVAGKVRWWGFSNFTAAQVQEVAALCDQHGYPRPVVSQPPYSWLRRDVEAEHLPVCRELNIAVTPYQPLQGGLLTGKYQRGQPLPADSRVVTSKWLAPPDDALYDRLDAFLAEAAARKMTPPRYALRWLLDQPGVTSVVVGVRSIEQLQALM